MDFEFECWRCGADCVVWGKTRGVINVWYELPTEWNCWNCDAINITPED